MLPDPSCRPPVAQKPRHAASNRGSRARSQAAIVTVDCAPTRFTPRRIVSAIGLTVLAQPTDSSIAFRQNCERAQASRRRVRPPGNPNVSGPLASIGPESTPFPGSSSASPECGYAVRAFRRQCGPESRLLDRLPRFLCPTVHPPLGGGGGLRARMHRGNRAGGQRRHRAGMDALLAAALLPVRRAASDRTRDIGRLHAYRNRIGVAPFQSTCRPSASRCSPPETMVRSDCRQAVPSSTKRRRRHRRGGFRFH